MPAFSLVSFDLDNMPRLERKADPPKKKEKTSVPAPAERKPKQAEATTSVAGPAAGAAAPKKDKKEKKEAKDKGSKADGAVAKKAGGKSASADEEAGEPVPSMIDLRVGHIVES